MIKKGKKTMEAVVDNMLFEMPSFKSGGSQALRIKKGLLDKVPAMANGVIAKVLSDSTVLLVASEPEEDAGLLDKEDDPMMQAFLSFLEKDITNNPAQLIAADAAYFAEFDDLLEGVDIDD